MRWLLPVIYIAVLCTGPVPGQASKFKGAKYRVKLEDLNLKAIRSTILVRPGKGQKPLVEVDGKTIDVRKTSRLQKGPAEFRFGWDQGAFVVQFVAKFASSGIGGFSSGDVPLQIAATKLYLSDAGGWFVATKRRPLPVPQALSLSNEAVGREFWQTHKQALVADTINGFYFLLERNETRILLEEAEAAEAGVWKTRSNGFHRLTAARKLVGTIALLDFDPRFGGTGAVGDPYTQDADVYVPMDMSKKPLTGEEKGKVRGVRTVLGGDSADWGATDVVVHSELLPDESDPRVMDSDTSDRTERIP